MQNLFPVNGNSFQRKPKLIATFLFYSSIRFVFETVFISEQIAENRFASLLKISEKFITKLNVLSYMILQFNSLENFITMLYDFKNILAR